MAFKDSVNKEDVEVIELYDFIYEDGTHFRATSYGHSYSWGGYTYYAIPISRDTQEQEATVKVGTTRITLELGDYTRTLIEVDKIRHQRILDRGEIYIYQVGLDAPTTNYRCRFNGFTGIVEIDRKHLTVEFRDIFFLLTKNVPVDIYGESCNLIFGGSRCSISLAGLKETGAAEAGSTTIAIVDSTRAEADGYFDRGYIVVTSGDLAGSKVTVRSFVTGQINLFPPLLAAMDPGDQYDIYPHCQKTYTRCLALANQANFFGFQYVPRPEQM